MKLSKNIKALIIAAAVLALLLGGYQGLKVYQANKAQNPQSSSPASSYEYITLTSLTREDIEAIELPGKGLRLEKRDDAWEAIPAFPGPIKQDEVTSITWSLSYVTAERIIDEDPQDLSIYGLDPPADRIVISIIGKEGEEGEKLELLEGGMNPSRTSYYVMKAGDPKVYLLSSYSASAIFFDPSRLREKALFAAFESSGVTRFSLENGGGSMEISLKPDEASLTVTPFSSHIMTSPYARGRGVDPQKFDTLLSYFQGLSIQSFVDPKPASLQPYGLDRPVRVALETAEGSLDLLLGKTENGLCYAQRRGEAEVFTLADPSSVLNTSPFSLVDKFALIVNIDRVDSFSVKGNGQTLSGGITRAGEDEAHYFYNGKEAEEKSFKGWYQKVIGLLVDAEHPDRPQKPGPAEITLEYQLNDPPGGRVSIGLSPYNRDFYALDSNGVVEFLISRSQVRDIYLSGEAMEYLE